MAKDTPPDAINIDELSRIMALDGPELLHEVTLTLHKTFNSQCCCVIEIDKINFTAQTLSFACEKQIQQQFSYSLAGTPCDVVSKSDKLFSLFEKDVSKQFPQDTYLIDNGVEAYLGIPLRNRAGDILGILLSTFTTATPHSNKLVDCHVLFANIIVHSLRAKWLSARSDTLVHQLSHEVSHDNLTGLLNRSYLSNSLEHITETRSEPFTLAYIDIDNFKSINDLYGNYIGDQVIKFVARAVEEALPEEHQAYRIAGDEFAFVTFSSDPLSICQTLISRLNGGYTDPSHTIKISVSIGLARTSDQRLTSDQLILNASLALKDCKQTRNSKVQSYDTHLSAQYYRRTMVIDALRNELDRTSGIGGEIYVAVQPIVSLESRTWDYFEVLARWNSETLGMVSPMEFIEAAEQSGLIIELGERIVELACHAKWELEQGLGYKVRLSLNCSAHELSDSSRYMRHLTSTISRYHFEPREFTIELTETVLLSQTNEVRYILDKLRNLGFTIALDDFGTGYSSLNYIHSYPIDTIKIDATFIKNMLCNETAEHVVCLIIQLAKRLDVNLVAEGVESEDALQKLSDMGCSQIQGYYFSKPEIPRNIIAHYSNICLMQPKIISG
ncbi:GGDEF family protein [Vibrio ichthyoenteri ATCC 700023]|uniref:GGDEF family protein n=1 Tax=Vibrio ichthyoenteri ATCC 700023 TaxID=870968 RepID=F9S1B6_9VIBR|nr:bifunctional diguanylate cyclase/phosphodiesterase [Vibrio ichthyoenteri]EGU41955.1 GGDEF family protein [Vibrio ichthyoenteri ATCC 700023]